MASSGSPSPDRSGSFSRDIPGSVAYGGAGADNRWLIEHRSSTLLADAGLESSWLEVTTCTPELELATTISCPETDEKVGNTTTEKRKPGRPSVDAASGKAGEAIRLRLAGGSSVPALLESASTRADRVGERIDGASWTSIKPRLVRLLISWCKFESETAGIDRDL
jgi:hypothetical protein